MSNETDQSDAQRQAGDEGRIRREDVVTKELVAHQARGNESGRLARRAHDGRKNKKRKLEEQRGDGCQTTRIREAHEALCRHREAISQLDFSFR